MVLSNIWSELRKFSLDANYPSGLLYNWLTWGNTHLWCQMHRAWLPQWTSGLLSFYMLIFLSFLECQKGTLLLFVFSDNQKYINVYAVCQKYIKHYQCWGGRRQPELRFLFLSKTDHSSGKDCSFFWLLISGATCILEYLLNPLPLVMYFFP